MKANRGSLTRWLVGVLFLLELFGAAWLIRAMYASKTPTPNLQAVGPILGPLIAATGALTIFLFDQQQKEHQFAERLKEERLTETLKHLADRENPQLRSSSVHYLSKLALIRDRGFARRTTRSSLFGFASNQLASALKFEPVNEVRLEIARAFRRLAPAAFQQPEPYLREMRQALVDGNLLMKREFLRSLANLDPADLSGPGDLIRLLNFGPRFYGLPYPTGSLLMDLSECDEGRNLIEDARRAARPQGRYETRSGQLTPAERRRATAEAALPLIAMGESLAATVPMRHRLPWRAFTERISRRQRREIERRRAEQLSQTNGISTNDGVAPSHFKASLRTYRRRWTDYADNWFLKQSERRNGPAFNGTGTVLPGLELRDRRLRMAVFNRAFLHSTDLSGSDLVGALLIETTGYGAVFAKSDLRAAILRGKFERCGFREADLRGARLRGEFQGSNFIGAKLADANLSDSNLRGAKLRGADLRGADLRQTDLREVADLTDAIYDETTDFEGAILYADHPLVGRTLPPSERALREVASITPPEENAVENRA